MALFNSVTARALFRRRAGLKSWQARLEKYGLEYWRARWPAIQAQRISRRWSPKSKNCEDDNVALPHDSDDVLDPNAYAAPIPKPKRKRKRKQT